MQGSAPAASGAPDRLPDAHRCRRREPSRDRAPRVSSAAHSPLAAPTMLSCPQLRHQGADLLLLVSAPGVALTFEPRHRTFPGIVGMLKGPLTPSLEADLLQHAL